VICKNNQHRIPPDTFLAQIFVDFNYIVDIPRKMSNMQGLKTLSLTQNLLRELRPGNLEALTNLERLKINHNRMECVVQNHTLFPRFPLFFLFFLFSPFSFLLPLSSFLFLLFSPSSCLLPPSSFLLPPSFFLFFFLLFSPSSFAPPSSSSLLLFPLPFSLFPAPNSVPNLRPTTSRLTISYELLQDHSRHNWPLLRP
jgi:hypothetical protein